MSRVANRQHFDQNTRTVLLEEDADRNDEQHKEMMAELKGIRMILIGLLVSAATGAVLLSINILVERGGV